MEVFPLGRLGYGRKKACFPTLIFYSLRRTQCTTLQPPRELCPYSSCRQLDVGRKVTLHSSYGRQLNITPGVKTWYLLVMIKIVTRTGNGTAQIRFHDNDLMNVKSIGNGTNVTHSITTFKRQPPRPSHLPYLWSKHKGNQKADCDTGAQNRPYLPVCTYVLAHTCLSSFAC